MLVPINITGGTYQSRSKPLSNEITQNLYAELVDNPSAKSKYVLHAFPGLSLFGTATGISRGLYQANNTLYRVCGTKLYEVSSAGTHTEIATIPGTSRCIFTGIGSNVIIVTQGIPYQWDGSTLTTINDADLETPQSATHLNNQIIYQGDNARFASSDVGDATSINSLNYATAESKPDNLVRVYAFDETLYLFGEKTIERWWNSGVGNPPFDRIQGGIFEVGLEAIHSVANNDNALYFLADDNHVYQIANGQINQVTDISTHRAIEGYGDITGAIGFCYTIEGQRFYQINFPVQNKTFLYSETIGQWYTLSSNGKRHYANSYAFVYRKHLVEDYRNGNLYELDINTYSDNGDAVKRIRQTGAFTGELIGKPGKRVEFKRLELIMETGVGLNTGQGSDPKIMMSFSDDGGRTWSPERWGSIGKSGEFKRRVEWHGLGSAYERIFRFSVSDPVYVSFHSGSLDIEAGI